MDARLVKMNEIYIDCSTARVPFAQRTGISSALRATVPQINTFSGDRREVKIGYSQSTGIEQSQQPKQDKEDGEICDDDDDDGSPCNAICTRCKSWRCENMVYAAKGAPPCTKAVAEAKVEDDDCDGALIVGITHREREQLRKWELELEEEWERERK